MSSRDLTAPSSQAKSELSEEAFVVGEDLYERIVDDKDREALRKVDELARASEQMEAPVEVQDAESATQKRRRRRVAPALAALAKF